MTKFFRMALLPALLALAFSASAQVSMEMEISRFGFMQYETIFAKVHLRNYGGQPIIFGGSDKLTGEIKWRLAAGDIERFAALQRALLNIAAARVRPGGRLVYSTCSLEPEENEQVVQALLTESPSFSIIGVAVPTGLRTPDGFLRTLPHRDGADGFFAAVLERT